MKFATFAATVAGIFSFQTRSQALMREDNNEALKTKAKDIVYYYPSCDNICKICLPEQFGNLSSCTIYYLDQSPFIPTACADPMCGVNWYYTVDGTIVTLDQIALYPSVYVTYPTVTSVTSVDTSSTLVSVDNLGSTDIVVQEGLRKKSKTEKLTKFDKEAAKKEIESLKKSLSKDGNFSTKEYKKNNKIYDSTWLVAQMRISRLVNLEQNLKNSEKKNMRNEADAAVTVDSVESENAEEVARTEAPNKKTKEEKKADKKAKVAEKKADKKEKAAEKKSEKKAEKKVEKAEKKAEVKAKVEAKAEKKAEVKAKVEAKSEKKAEVKVEAKSDKKAEAKPVDAKVAAKVEAKVEKKPDAKVEAKPVDAKVATKVEAKSDKKVDAKVEAKPVVTKETITTPESTTTKQSAISKEILANGDVTKVSHQDISISDNLVQTSTAKVVTDIVEKAAKSKQAPSVKTVEKTVEKTEIKPARVENDSVDADNSDEADKVVEAKIETDN